MKNVLEWLEGTVVQCPTEPVYKDAGDSITFEMLYDLARTIGTKLAEIPAGPIAVFGSRTCRTPALYLGVVYSGHPYAPLDAKQPTERLVKILHAMKPSAVLYDDSLQSQVQTVLEELSQSCDMDITAIDVAGIREAETDQTILDRIRRSMVSTDPLYIIYTSGSTGIPKGVITSHDSLIRYIDAYAGVMGIDETDCLGNQSPLDYIAAIRDIYLPLKTGCSMAIIPKECFMDPNRLFTYMNEKKVTSVGWSVSAFTVAAALGGFEEVKLNTLRKICFSGSVMPAKCLKLWQQNLVDALFVNQYGPTEVTASCTYYVVDHEVDVDEVLPIGIPYDNYHVFILREDGSYANTGELGEICVSGPCLALGYYQDPERTEAAFLQNPANKAYQERIYKTGDIGLMREDGVFEFHGRRDRQIKHMGHRVELDEVELAASQIPDVDECCCIYQKEKETIHLFYSGAADRRSLSAGLKEVLPAFMIPRGIHQLEAMPKLANGKTNMGALKELTIRKKR